MKILSIDIGSYAIKAVELDISFGKIELSDYVIEKIKPQENTKENTLDHTQKTSTNVSQNSNQPQSILTSEQVTAIRYILAERLYQYDKLVVNVPKGWVTSRVFQFPTKDRKTILSSLAFELEDEVPFSANEMFYDFVVLNSSSNQSTVFATVALKRDIEHLVTELKKIGLDADMLTSESWSYGQLIKRSMPVEYEGHPVCVVDFGNRETSIHMYVGENPILTHICSCGGQDVTQAIAETYNLNFDDAEQAKIDGAFVLTQTHFSGMRGIAEISQEQKDFSNAIAKPLQNLVREIKQTLMSYKNLYKLSPKAIFITGGSSLIPNLALFLEEQVRVPVFNFNYISKVVGESLQLSETSEAEIATAVGLGLSLLKPDKNSTINFRKEHLSKASGLSSINWQSYKKPIQYLSFSLLFIYANLITQQIILNKKLADQDLTFERAIKSAVGAVSPSMMNTYKNSPSTLKSAVNKEIAKYKANDVTPNKSVISAFELLNKLSTQMPKNIVLDVNHFQIKDAKLQLSGVVDQANQVEGVVQALQETNLIKDLNKDTVISDPKTKKTKFDFTAKVAEASTPSSTPAAEKRKY